MGQNHPARLASNTVRPRAARAVGVLFACAFGGCAVYDPSLLTGNEALPIESGGSGVNVAGTGSSAGNGGGAGSSEGGAANPPDPAPDGGTSGSVAGTDGLAGSAGDSSSGGALSGAGGTMESAGAMGGALGGAAGNSPGGATTMAGASGAGTGGTAIPNGGSGGVVDRELAKGKKALASSQQTGNEAPKGNDNNASTRWCAGDATYPQWWRVDLGAVYALKDVTLQFEHPERQYSYVIETSSNDAVYMQEATVNGSGAVQNVSLPANVSARYVRITVTGATPGPGYPTWASFFEISLKGH